MANDVMFVGSAQFAMLTGMADPWGQLFAKELRRPPGWYTKQQREGWFLAYARPGKEIEAEIAAWGAMRS